MWIHPELQYQTLAKEWTSQDVRYVCPLLLQFSEQGRKKQLLDSGLAQIGLRGQESGKLWEEEKHEEEDGTLNGIRFRCGLILRKTQLGRGYVLCSVSLMIN